MNITILFLVSGFIAIYTYRRTELKLLSPVFWGSISIFVFSGVYVLTYSTMLNDISISTLLILLGAIGVTVLGSFFGFHFKTGKTYNTVPILQDSFYNGSAFIVIPKWKTLVFTAIYMIIAVTRFRNFFRYVNGSLQNLADALSGMRMSYDAVADGSLSLSNGYFNQIGYMCEIALYIHLFAFVFNLMVAKKNNPYLLLPLVPDLLNRLVTTSRSAFLLLFFSISVCVIFVLVKQGRCKQFLFSSRTVIALVLIFSLFFWYGQMRNNLDISLLDNVQMYSSASIYNFDKFIREGRHDNPYFGYYTLQRIYDVFGITYTQVAQDLPMNVFNTHGYRSNIWTSFFKTVQDYGVGGMLLLRFLESLFGTMVIKTMLKSKLNSSRFFFCIYFVIIILYSFANYPIGNRFSDFLANGTVLLRYAVYGWILIKYLLTPRVLQPQEQENNK